MGLFDVFNTNQTTGRDSAEAGGRTVFNAYDDAQKALTSGFDNATSWLGRADSYYQPLYDNSLRGSNMYANALGLNGTDGNTAATSAYRTMPGYQFALNQGLDAVNRKASAGGMLSSGNTMMALNDYAKGMADKDYGGWLDRLGGLGQQAVGIAGARAGIAGQQAGNNMAFGNTLGNWRMGTGKNVADMTIQGAQYDQKANSAASGNLWSAIAGGANLALGGFGMPSFGGGTSSLNKQFGPASNQIY